MIISQSTHRSILPSHQNSTLLRKRCRTTLFFSSNDIIFKKYFREMCKSSSFARRDLRFLSRVSQHLAARGIHSTIILFSAQMRSVVERRACLPGLQRMRRLLPTTAVPALRWTLSYRVEARPHHGEWVPSTIPFLPRASKTNDYDTRRLPY